MSYWPIMANNDTTPAINKARPPLLMSEAEVVGVTVGGNTSTNGNWESLGVTESSPLV